MNKSDFGLWSIVMPLVWLLQTRQEFSWAQRKEIADAIRQTFMCWDDLVKEHQKHMNYDCGQSKQSEVKP